MSFRHTTRRLSVDEVLECATSVANFAMLRTYAEPSPVQISAIDEYTSLLDSKLGSLLPHDASTRDRILAQLDIHRSVLAPIRRLPKELLIDIFFRLADESPFRTLYVSVTLARVCAVWRAVAHGLSKLWTKLVVKSISNFDGYCHLFLPYAKGSLLDLRCDDRELVGRVWDRIERHASRWRSITLEGRLSMLPDLKIIYLENLERLVVDAYDEPVSTGLSALDFAVAPCLQHVALTLDALQSERQLHVPAMRMLTSLEMITESPFPVTLILPLLRACANTLQSLTLKIRFPLEGPEGSYPTSASYTFGMKALTFLSLVDPACALLNHITAPLIEALILSNVPTYGTRSLLGFLIRSQETPTLFDLRVYIPEEREPSAWIPCLRLMDNLRDLHFDAMLSNTEFLEQIVRHTDRPVLLPSLAWVTMVKIYMNHEELRPIIHRLTRSRRKCVFTPDGQPAWQTIGWFEEV